MADVKITALPAATVVVAGTDVLPLVTGGGTTTSKATPTQIVSSALTATPVTAAQGGTGLTALGTGVATFLGTPSAANLKAAVTEDTGSGSLVFATSPTLVTPTLGAATATTVLAGTNASLTDFPNAKVIGSTGNTTDAHDYNIGVIGEAIADPSDTNIWGVGVYGVASSNGAVRSAGVLGDGHVGNTADTGSAVGVRGYATQTHAGGFNIGLYAEASGSTVNNYALYNAAGDFYSNAAQNWFINGNLTFNGLGNARQIGVTNGAVFALGTPVSGTLTNCTGLLGTGITFTALTNATLPLVGTETVMINDGVSNKKTTVLSLAGTALYGELYVASGTVAQTSNATPETYNKLTCFATVGVTNGTTPSASTDSITFPTGGVYLISFFNTFTSSNNKTFRFRLYNETTAAAYVNTVVSCTTATTNPTFVAYSALVPVGAGNVLSVQFTSATNSETLTITDANISAVLQAGS